jgi:hypothetical protein
MGWEGHCSFCVHEGSHMTSRLWQSRQSSGQSSHGPVDYDDFDDYEDVPAMLVAGDRVGAHLPDRSGRRVLRVCVAMLGTLGAGWAAVENTVTWPVVLAGLSAVNRPSPVPPPAEQAAAVAPPAPLQALPAMEVAATPGTEAGAVATPPAPLTEPSAPASGQAAGVAAIEPLKPAVPDPKDPKQVKAAAVGLHPDVSRALLTRLTESDYRNAGVAIKMALAQTPDSDVLEWPQTPKPDAAQFQVRFVTGATGDCRRYVVEITKDKWVTTAPAMEKCGLPAVKVRG